MRKAASEIESRITLPFDALYRPTRLGLGFTLPDHDVARRSAWALIGEWLVAASVQAPSTGNGLAAVHDWFWAGSGRELGIVPDVPISIDGASAAELRALLPYLLDAMAPATRRDLLNARSTVQERRTRKASGTYYTPGDVAQLMVERVLAAGRTSGSDLWLDPAHGSGVFLRAAYWALAGQSDADSRLYGVDLDPVAAEATSFVLTAEALVLDPASAAPWERWHRFRRNLATGDALLIDATPSSLQTALVDSSTSPLEGCPLGHVGPWQLDAAFPESAAPGFARIVANPPYAPLKQTASSFHIPHLHPVTGSSARADISPVFVELCSNLLPHAGALAIVLPLSMVSSTRSPYPQLRRHLSQQPGSLEFLSFDRAPDALFGDDIKTRNAIVCLDSSAPNAITASPLYRWTSRTRATALSNIPVVSVADLSGVPETIPKIGREWERELLLACDNSHRYLARWYSGRRTLPLDRVAQDGGVARSRVLALAPTAYNFLGVIREPLRAVADGHSSQNGFSLLQFDSEERASAAYALLSSRLAFWLWHVTGDGFHVTNALHHRVPVPWGDTGSARRLADLGDQLWQDALQSPVISSNRGRTTVAYPAWPHVDLIDEIDAEMGNVVGMPCKSRLSAWHEQLVVVDVDSERRNLIGGKIGESRRNARAA